MYSRIADGRVKCCILSSHWYHCEETYLQLRRNRARRLSGNVWSWLLIDDQASSLRQTRDGVFLDSCEEVLACRDVVDKANDLAGSPDLQRA